MDRIYLDYNASAPLDPAVLEAMRPHWLAPGNPDSRHSAGRAARRALTQATETVARILAAAPEEVVFTSGGTEANNLAIFGLADRVQAPGHVIASPMEHPAVAEPITRLEQLGFGISRPPVQRDGRADVSQMLAAIQPDTRFATLILAHNETGAIQPVKALADSLASTTIPVHTDAAQAVGRIPVDFHGLGVATLAASAHKFQGPVGVGLLLVRAGTKLIPRLLGGAQQANRRPGTIPVALVVGLATALERWHFESQSQTDQWRLFRNRFEQGLVSALGQESIVRHGPNSDENRLPQTLHVAFPGLDGDALLMQLDLAGVAASLGSACASGSTRPSPSLEAIGVPPDQLRSSVRFSFGAGISEQDIDEAIRRVVKAVETIQRGAQQP
jgi:cysteine desulfurase